MEIRYDHKIKLFSLLSTDGHLKDQDFQVAIGGEGGSDPPAARDFHPLFKKYIPLALQTVPFTEIRENFSTATVSLRKH